MSGRRRFTPAELAWALKLLRQGMNWHRIGLSLGRSEGKSIRAHFDPVYRQERNASVAKSARDRRAARRAAKGAP